MSKFLSSLLICLSVLTGFAATKLDAADADSGICQISNNESGLQFCILDAKPGDRTVIYFDLENCRISPTHGGYPFELVSVSFSLYYLSPVSWPVHVDVVVYDRVANGHQCDGPGNELYRIPVLCDSATYFSPAVGTVAIPSPSCINGPFFVGIEYTETGPLPIPSLMIDHHTDTSVRCKGWYYYGATNTWQEWKEKFWSVFITGFPVMNVEVRSQSPNCNAACFQVADFDDNGIFTISDCSLHMSWLANGGIPSWLYMLDLNGDCTISQLEKNQPQSYCFGPFPEPPPPENRCTCPQPWVEDCECEPGDADGNELHTISDAVYMINYIFAGGPTPTPYLDCSGDADGNCLVTISDAVYLINYIFAGGPAPYNCLYWPLDCGGLH